MMRVIFLYFAVVSAELEMVQVLLRHGDRAPSFTYPSDSNFDVDRYFPRGFSQLTENGFQQARELGTFLRSRYSKFTKKYDRKKVLFRSSDKDRCIETASGLAGKLFPDEMTVPIHTFSNYKQDLLLKPNSVKCRLADQIVENDKKNHNKLIDSQYSTLFDFLSLKTGWKVDGSNIENIYNVLYRKHVNSVPQPEWVYSRLPASSDNQTVLEKVIELKRQSRMLSFNSDLKSKLRTGYLLGEITRDMQRKAQRVSARNMIVYSSHDATLTSLMYSLGISNHQLPPYTAALMIEMHQIEEHRFVRILLRNSSNEDPHELVIPGCDTMCPFSYFQQHVDERSIANREEFEELCGNTETSSQNILVPETTVSISEQIPAMVTVGMVSMLDLVAVVKSKE